MLGLPQRSHLWRCLWRFVVGKFSVCEINMAKCESDVSFRFGRVKAYRRNKIWYLCYHEDGKRRRPRVGADRTAARRLAAQINGQLEIGVVSSLAFEPISISALRTAWLTQKDVFGAQYTSRLYLCERFALPVAQYNTSLGDKAAG